MRQKPGCISNWQSIVSPENLLFLLNAVCIRTYIMCIFYTLGQNVSLEKTLKVQMILLKITEFLTFFSSNLFNIMGGW